MPTDRNSETLADHARRRKATTSERVRAAMREVEARIARGERRIDAKHRITKAEILASAGVGSSTLRNKHHRDLNAELDRWLADCGGEERPQENGAADLREQLAWYKDAVRRCSAELVKLCGDLETLRRENGRLRQEIARLCDGQEGTVIPLRGGDRR